MNVYELTQEYERIEELLETIEDMKASGEDGLEQFEADTLHQFAVLREAIGEKIDNVGKLICNLESEAAAKKQEAKRLKDQADRQAKKIEYLKTHLVKPLIEATEGGKITGELFTMSLRKSTAVFVSDDAVIPNEYVKIKTTTAPDKAAIKKAIQGGAEIPGAELRENKTVQIR